MEKRRGYTLEPSPPGTWLYFPYFSRYAISLMPKNAILQYKNQEGFLRCNTGSTWIGDREIVSPEGGFGDGHGLSHPK